MIDCYYKVPFTRSELRVCINNASLPPYIPGRSEVCLQRDIYYYGKCSKISNTLLFFFSNKIVVIRAGIYKILVRIANREDPDQTASSEAV